MSNFSWSISQIRRGHLNFCAVKCKNLGLALLGFSVYSILGVKFDLILVLRSRFVEYLRETLYKHALEHLEAARSEKQRFFFLPTVNSWLLLASWRPVTGRDTFSALAPVLGPSQKNGLCHPLPLFMAVSMIPNMWHSSCYCMRQSWLTKIGVICLIPSVNTPEAQPGLVRAWTTMLQ